MATETGRLGPGAGEGGEGHRGAGRRDTFKAPARRHWRCPMGSVAGHPLSSSFLCLFPLPLDSRSFKDSGSAQSPSLKQKANVPPEAPKMDLLTVPVVDTEMEARPMTLEEMEDVGKHYRERKRQNKVPLPTGEGRGWGARQAGPACPTCPTFWPGELWGSPLPRSLFSVCEQHLPPKVSHKMS